MRKIYYIIYSLIFFIFFNITYSQTPKYIFFDNFDSWAQKAYWEPLQNTDHIVFFEKAAFDASWFNSHKITDYDVAIFPLGNNGLNATYGGHKVSDEINKMIDAGKNCIIISRLAISSESGSDFFKNKIGIQYVATMDNFSDGDSRFLGFWVHGAEGDPVSLGTPKFANQGNGNTGEWPLAFYSSQVVFKITKPEVTSRVDHWKQLIQNPRTDTLIGCKTEIGNSRIVYWNIGFENFAGDEVRRQLLDRAVRWCMPEAPDSGPQIEALSTNVEFGSVKMGKSSEQVLAVQNSGDKNLVIDDIYIFEGTDWFEITEGDAVPITLKPKEIHAVTIKFTPDKDGEEYAGIITFESNDPDFSDNPLDIALMGSGGEVGMGPQIASNFDGDTIQYGKQLMSTDTFLVVRNSGDETLVINKIELIDNPASAFAIQQEIKVPIYLNPGESISYKVRFAAIMVEPGNYTARIKFTSNAKNNATFYVNLVGEKPGEEKKGPQITTDAAGDLLDFGITDENKNIFLQIRNTGDEDLIINSIEIVDDESSAFSFPDGVSVPLTLVPTGVKSYRVRFDANKLAKGTYTARIKFMSNAKNNETFYVNLVGEKPTGSDVPDLSGESDDGIVKLKVLPNPLSQTATIELTYTGTTPEKTELIIYNNNGEKLDVLPRKILSIEANHIRLDLSKYPAGQYYVVARNGASVAGIKVLVVR